MNNIIIGIDRTDGSAVLTLRNPPASQPIGAIRVVEQAKDGTAISISLGDTIRFDEAGPLWTPKAQPKPEAERTAGVDFDIPLALA